MRIDQVPRAVCHSLLVEWRNNGIEELPAHDARVDAALGDILSFFEDQCRSALASNLNDKFVDECLYVLDRLGPDASTGRHDLFWANLRELQPGLLSIGNPTYRTASISEHHTHDDAYDLGERWKGVIQQSAKDATQILRR